MLEIREANDADFDEIWHIFHEVVEAGESFPFAHNTSKEEAHLAWIKIPTATYVAIIDNQVLGTYYIKPNQSELGAHVCNAGYMVNAAARGQGIGRSMCLHSLDEARKLGFRAMQYNLVVATNESAVNLYKQCGFSIIGTLPESFNHKRLGLVDAHVMYQLL